MKGISLKSRAATPQSRRIRHFELRDLPAILRIERASFAEDAWDREIFDEYIAKAPDLFLVAVAGEKIAGYILAARTRTGAEIASVAVLPAYRKAGIARMLIKKIIRKIARAHGETIWLMVRPDNDNAIALYRSVGFVHTRTVANYYENGASGWKMTLRINP